MAPLGRWSILLGLAVVASAASLPGMPAADAAKAEKRDLAGDAASLVDSVLPTGVASELGDLLGGLEKERKRDVAADAVSMLEDALPTQVSSLLEGLLDGISTADFPLYAQAFEDCATKINNMLG
ncbi:hypothetical protein Sste5346_000949 [Sporothrix stenoceras]|uniref:Secreted protein n=1 Tax=Sporothrix stenoceras TaxID=5173 RepID=A0ABR3ZQR8_9PEZI